MPTIGDLLRIAGARGNEKEAVAKAVEAALGRRQLWRTARFFYRYARRDGPNDPTCNGEYLLQERVAQVAAARKQGLRVFDIGAHVGEWTKHMLAAGHKAGVGELRLWSVEPSQDIVEALQATVAACPGQHCARVIWAAVADSTGVARFEASSGLAQTKHLLSDEDAAAGGYVEVKQMTVDALLAEHGVKYVEFVKSDVEGYDLAVLRGALGALQAGGIGVLQFEYNHRWVSTRSYLKDVYALIEDLPYSLGKVVPDGIDIYPAWHPEMEAYIEANYVLVHESWLGDLGVRYGSFGVGNAYATGA